jgi:hypothetical protein
MSRGEEQGSKAFLADGTDMRNIAYTMARIK